MFNNGSEFNEAERDGLGLSGLLPPTVSTLAQQVQRVYENIARKPDAVEKYIGLAALHDRSEVPFYRLLLTAAAALGPCGTRAILQI